MCSDRFRNERTDQAIFHIFQGKKSIQTIQDTYLYKLEPYYQILPYVRNTYFTMNVQSLVQDGLMEPSHSFEHSFTITAKGKEVVRNATLPHIVTYLHGKKYSTLSESFEKRLLLFFQVVSNKQMNNRMYVPVIDDYLIMNDIKRILKQISADNQKVAQQLYEELTHIFTELEEPYPTMFIDRLTGYQHYGKSMQQLARDHQMEEIDLHIIWKSIVHYMIEQCRNEKSAFPLLTSFMHTDEENSLTSSAKQTKSHLTQGLTVEQIAHKRRLKLNTIYDHIVEIALQDTMFAIDAFINEEQIETILQLAYALNTYQLRALKASLGDGYSYFQIRLALARGGNRA